MISDGSACEGRTVLVRVVHSNSVVEWKVTLGVEVQLHPEVGASFSSCVG